MTGSVWGWGPLLGSSPGTSVSLPGGEAPGRGPVTPEFLWRLCVQADEGVQGKLPPHLRPFKYLQLNVISTSKWYMLGCQVLNA